MKKVLIHGKVQGVFFRRFVRDNALKLGLKGYVKNLKDGSVEAVFDGEKIDEMIKLCKKGPIGSNVEKVDIEDYSGEAFDSFAVRY